MESFKIEIDRREIVNIIEKNVYEKVRVHMQTHEKDIEKSIEQYFKRSFFNDKQNEFENAIDYTVEMAFREGINKAMEEMNFKEIIATKAKELLSSDNLIQELAEAKVRSSLGLPVKLYV